MSYSLPLLFYPFKDVTVQMSSFVRLHLPILQSSFVQTDQAGRYPPYPGLSSIKISLRPIFIPPYSALQGSALSLPAGLYIQKSLSDFPHPDWHSTHRKGTASRTDLHPVEHFLHIRPQTLSCRIFLLITVLKKQSRMVRKQISRSPKYSLIRIRTVVFPLPFVPVIRIRPYLSSSAQSCKNSRKFSTFSKRSSTSPEENRRFSQRIVP